MSEHFTHESEQSAEAPQPRVLSKNELDDIELQVREILDSGVTHNDLRAVVSSLLESHGQSALAEGEMQRRFMLDIDGEEVEQVVFVDPSDFGTFIRSTQEMGISDQPEVEQDAAIEEDDEEESTEHLNEEAMFMARRKLDDLLDASQSEQRVITGATQELVDSMRRGIVDMDAVEREVSTVWRRLNALVEETDAAMSAFIRIEAELDTRSSLVDSESQSLQQAAVDLRRSARLLEEEAAYPIRILLSIADEARHSPEAQQELKRRSAQAVEQIQGVLMQQLRTLQKVEL